VKQLFSRPLLEEQFGFVPVPATGSPCPVLFYVSLPFQVYYTLVYALNNGNIILYIYNFRINIIKAEITTAGRGHRQNEELLCLNPEQKFLVVILRI
jgi:hypothetical protein